MLFPSTIRSAVKGAFLSIVYLTCFATFVTAQDWVASTGTVDPAGGSHARFNGGIVFIDSAAPAPTTVTVRYNILPLLPISPPLAVGECWELIVRYTDNGSGSRVTLSVKQYDLAAGQTKTLLSFDSNSFPASDGFQTRSACAPFNFLFASTADGVTVPDPALAGLLNVYFIEAKLTRGAVGGNPKLGGFSLNRNTP